MNAWVVALLVPSLHLGPSLEVLIGTSAPLLVLGLGLALPAGASRRERPASAGRPPDSGGSARRATLGSARCWALLAGYPGAIGAVLAWRSELAERDAHGPVGLTLAALSILAFVAAAAHASSLAQPESAVQTQTPLERDPVAEPRARRWVRRLLLGASAAGALALSLMAPALASRRERVERWGDGADDATVLAAVVGAIVGCVALGVIVGPALRAARVGGDPPGRRQRRLAAAMLVAVAAGVAWLVLRHFDRAAGA